ADGTFEKSLGGKKPETKTFNAGPQAMEALLAGELDACYVGSSPAVLAYVRSGGRIRVLAGAARGGSALVVRGAESAQDLVGKQVATPQIGNTQDLALRRWLRGQG